MARRTQRVAFACSFVQRSCPHDPMFHDGYQRCFPHCCPRHVERSYCGGPVYLQVDLADGDPCALDDVTLSVFAHFHPTAMPGLALGQFVARAMFSENQQTDTNATGEWIGARLMASADRTTWMFEVNPSGRWYYQWESGATKAQRATLHVFEAYVLVVAPATGRCEVVAKTTSCNFKMISFRRAPALDPTQSTPEIVPSRRRRPPKPVATALRVDDDNDEGEEEHGHENDDAGADADQDAEHETAAVSALRWRQRASVDSLLSSDAEIVSQMQTLLEPHANESGSASSTRSRRSVPASRSRSRSRSRSPSPYAATDESDHVEPPLSLRPPMHVEPPLSLRPPVHVAQIAHALGALLDLVQALPCSSLALVASDVTRLVLAPWITDAPTSLAALLLPCPSYRVDPSSPPFPPALASVVLRLVLWWLFDREHLEAQEHYVERASEGLLDKRALYESYFNWLERLHTHVEAYLTATRVDVSLGALARDAEQWLHAAAGPAGLSMRLEVLSTPSNCRGLEAFVAQAREVFLAGADLRPRRRRRLSAPQLDVVHHQGDELQLFSSVWIVDLDSIDWHSVPGVSDQSRSVPSSSPSAFVMLWAWRQALALDLAVDDDVAAPAPASITVSSLWNASRGTSAVARGSRLVLDGKPRWLRVFPSGESTSSVELGAQRLGHYVASFRPEMRELLVNVYSWPTAHGTGTAAARCCFCLRWCLRLAPSGNVLDTRVAIERGALRHDADVDALNEHTLTQKLQAVERWTTAASLECTYQRRTDDAMNRPDHRAAK